METDFKRKSKNPFADFSLFCRYLKIIKREEPDIVLTYTIKPNIYGGLACRLLRQKQIANITGLGSTFVSEHSNSVFRGFVSCLYKIGLRKASFVFFQNPSNQQYCIVNKLVSSPHSVLPGSGVNLHSFPFIDYPQESSTLRFAFIGRLMKQKGIEDYLYAAQTIKKNHPCTEFHIIGALEEKRYEKRILTLQEKGIVVYHGIVDDVRPFLKDIHCTIHPSYYPEGMSNVVLESCASGRPVITTDLAGCKDAIEDTKNGFIVKHCDRDDLINRILKFIALPHQKKEEMGIYARKKMEMGFDRQFVIKAYLEKIGHLLRN